MTTLTMRLCALLAVAVFGAALVSAVPAQIPEVTNTSAALSFQDLLGKPNATTATFEILPDYLSAASVWGSSNLGVDQDYGTLTMASSGGMEPHKPTLVVGMWGPPQHIDKFSDNFDYHIANCVDGLCPPSGCIRGDKFCKFTDISYDAKGKLSTNAHLEIRARGTYANKNMEF
ncbi:hypothetical protein M011DRAFT_462549 [Sporormia fimetaria CBS 119925]|uniref:Uncharacterized protein n=1 Tax=Sporormia fimetaria CBS 119925 TaxID=1340428 RepID=A0A6A6UX15_9PLEO|nr:hypothetical protein M011DRAFT_462549 [Sporormia fimetaria CBS 119925]